MPTKPNGSGEMQEYNSSNGRWSSGTSSDGASNLKGGSTGASNNGGADGGKGGGIKEIFDEAKRLGIEMPENDNFDVLKARVDDAKQRLKSGIDDDMSGKTHEEYVPILKEAKASQPPNRAWRVSSPDVEEFKQEHPSAKLYSSNGGSCIGVDADGDIISVCKKIGDSVRGSDLLKYAIANGGTKLDSYSGNHDFYIRNGFEPVSWCEWNDDFAPDDWVEKRDEREPIIFYKYTGKATTESEEEFMKRISPSPDYDSARKQRDKDLEE